MNFNRPLTPEFLKKWDENLLLNKPDTWSARTHLVVYYCLLFIGALFLICFAVPNDPRTSTSVYLWVIFVALISFVGFIVWLIFLLRFNVFKRFGNIDSGNSLKTFMLYFVAIGMMVLCCYVPPVVESIRANNAYSSPELARDINTMNIDLLQLERDSVQLRWDRDTFLVVHNVYRPNIAPSVNEEDTETIPPEPTVVRGYTRVDTAMFRERLDRADSSVKINDSMYMLFECPDYEFITSFGVNKALPDSVLHSVDLYRKVLVNYHRPNREKVSAELHALLNKYRSEDDYSRYDVTVEREDPSDIYRRDFKSRISTRYSLYGTNNRINNIAYRKYRWDNLTLSVSARVFYYTTLILTLLVYVFRRSSVRTFFLSKLAALLITIFTSLFLVFTSSESEGVLIIILAYYAAFLIMAVLIPQSSVRSVFQGIALNLAVYCTPFLPLVVVSLYYDILRKQHRFEQDTERYFRHEFRDFQIAEIVGFVLLIALLTFVFKRLYRLWFAQPEQ